MASHYNPEQFLHNGSTSLATPNTRIPGTYWILRTLELDYI